MRSGQPVGRHVLLERVGKGGMGEVWLAAVQGEPPVILKCIRDEGILPVQAVEFRRRFQREAEITTRLRHPHIVEAHEHFEHDGGLFLVLERVDGPTLADWLDSAPPLPERMRVLRQVASALVYAHAQDLVHRDLKPLNVLVAEGPCAKVIDFGLARVYGATRLTRTGIALGTIGYMAPEQAYGWDVDGRADVFSLGMMLARALELRDPFRASSPSELYFRLASTEPVPLEEWLPDDLRGALQRLLAKESAGRLDARGAEALLEGLEAEGEALAARVERARAAGRAAHVPRLASIARPECDQAVDALASRLAARSGGAVLFVSPPGGGRSHALKLALERLGAAGYARDQVRFSRLDRIGGELWGLLCRLRPELAESSPEVDVESRTGMARALAELLRARKEPLVLGIDDLQNASVEELSLVEALVEIAESRPLALVLACDPSVECAEAGLAAYSAFLGRIGAVPALRRVDLGPLPREAVAVELAQHEVPSEVGDEVFRLAGGKPALINELLALWRQGASLAPLMSEASPAQAEALRSRLERLPEGSRRLVAALVSMGGEGRLDELVRAAGLPRLAAQAQLRDLRVSHGWVSVEGDRIAIAQPFLAAVVGVGGGDDTSPVPANDSARRPTQG